MPAPGARLSPDYNRLHYVISQHEARRGRRRGWGRGWGEAQRVSDCTVALAPMLSSARAEEEEAEAEDGAKVAEEERTRR